MKKILLALLVFCFNINNSFASPPSSFEKKLEVFEQLVINGNYNPKQSQIILDMSIKGFTKCLKASSGSGYICRFPEQLCIISQNSDGTSLKCFEEADLDKLLNG